MRGRFLLPWLATALASWASSARAAERAFATTEESATLEPGASQLSPWTTFRAGRERYFSRLEGELRLEHGLMPGLELGLRWGFASQSRDRVIDPLGEIERDAESELTGATFALKYRFTDRHADALGSALQLASSVGPRRSQLAGRVVVDRGFGKLLLAANLSADYQLEPRRDADGTELRAAFTLEPGLAAAYALPAGFGLGLELRAPLGLSGEPESSALFGGPVVSWTDRRLWLVLGVQPQLVALSGRTPERSLDLTARERIEVRLLAGLRW